MRSRFRLDTLAAAAAALLALALYPRLAAADHSGPFSCYICHNLKSTSIYKGTRAIDKTKEIGLSPAAAVTQPLNCEFCHTEYTSEVNASKASNHPVMHINGSVMDVHINGSTYSPESGYTGIKLRCASCHAGNTVGGNPSPDLAPPTYDQTGKNTTTDGYPNHQLAGTADNAVAKFANAWATYAAGDSPHAVAAYNPKASTDPATDYALCFSCHDGSTDTTNRVDVSTAYTATGGGHYFKSTPTVRIACSDCHDTHGAAGVKLYNRNFGGPVASDPNKRAICLNCHDGASHDFTTTTATTASSITVPLPPRGSAPGAVAAHETTSTSACTLCHDPHNPAGGRTDCWDCHSTNTTAAMKTALGGSFAQYVDDGPTVGGDDFAYAGTNPSKHNITFADGNSAHCLDCHVIAAGKHGNGSTHDDLTYKGPNGVNWPVSNATETGNTFGSGIEFCLGCHRGGTTYWGQTPPAVNTYVDFGTDGKSGDANDVTNNYGQGDATVTGYSSNSPTIYDTATGATHDPPSGFGANAGEVPMFAHYTQGATSGGTKWWQLGTTTAPQPLPCMDCHNAHGAPNHVLYRSPRSTPSTGIAKGSRTICLDCHATTVTVEGRDALDPTTTTPLADRYGNPVPAHNSGASQSCSSSTNECHHPHTPSCEVCHAYPPVAP